MDAFDELERMALNAAEPEYQASPSEVARWRRLFSYSCEQATHLIEQQMNDYVRSRVSDGHWDMVRQDWEARGYDRHAYEHELSIGNHPAILSTVSSTITASQARARYLVKLEGALSTAEHIRVAAGMQQLPLCVRGQGDEEAATFGEVDGVQKQAIIDWLTSQAGTFNLKPTFVRITKARKEFSPSWYPTLGIDTTLPQYRANAEHGAAVEPAQDSYPVWYFFYGTLAIPTILSQRLSLPEEEPPVLLPASVGGGKLETWGGKYKALVNEPGGVVHGSAYQVVSQEQEDALCWYETDSYEVVRCTISFDNTGDQVQGCTFRFLGDTGDYPS